MNVITWITKLWKVEKPRIAGGFTLAMLAVMLTGGTQGPHHVNWYGWIDQLAWWTVGPGAAMFLAVLKARGVTGGETTTQGMPAPPAVLVEAAKPGADPVPVQPLPPAEIQTPAVAPIVPIQEKLKNPWG